MHHPLRLAHASPASACAASASRPSASTTEVVGNELQITVYALRARTRSNFPQCTQRGDPRAGAGDHRRRSRPEPRGQADYRFESLQEAGPWRRLIRSATSSRRRPIASRATTNGDPEARGHPQGVAGSRSGRPATSSPGIVSAIEDLDGVARADRPRRKELVGSGLRHHRRGQVLRVAALIVAGALILAAADARGQHDPADGPGAAQGDRDHASGGRLDGSSSRCRSCSRRSGHRAGGRGALGRCVGGVR